MDEQQRPLLLTDVPTPIFMAESRSQGSSCEMSFGHRSLHRTLPSIIIPRATSSTKGLQRGSSEATNSPSGRTTAHYCGSTAIVRMSVLVVLP